ncbi:MAG: hypothetical protein ABH875_01460 [Candidatus Omnitrophota bacterium]
MLQQMSSLCKDYVASNIRSKIMTLKNILYAIENDMGLGHSEMENMLKGVEEGIRNLRKRCDC